MTKGWQIFGSRVGLAVDSNIVEPLGHLGQVAAPKDGDFKLGQIPNLHSLIPYSLAARKPVFNCGSRDGLKGAHLEKARNSRAFFKPLADSLQELIQNTTDQVGG